MESIFSVPALAAIVVVVVGLGKIIEILVTKSIPKQSVLEDEE